MLCGLSLFNFCALDSFAALPFSVEIEVRAVCAVVGDATSRQLPGFLMILKPIAYPGADYHTFTYMYDIPLAWPAALHTCRGMLGF